MKTQGYYAKERIDRVIKEAALQVGTQFSRHNLILGTGIQPGCTLILKSFMSFAVN